MTTKTKGPRKTPPLCGNCHHPQSFHLGSAGQCRSIGCKNCQAFTPMKPKPVKVA